ncbi:MAG TPA: LEPR-XLL domain-containing protein, partial [Stellaceae bacterium]|nr:LEPR-XLL domain-containing protein [Stellaceae bacterium]
MAFPFYSADSTGSAAHAPRKTRRRRLALARLWHRRGRTAPADIGRRRLALDPLEPRLLLNADVVAINLAHDLGAPPIDHSLLVQLAQQTEEINHQAVTLQRVQVVDKNDGAVLAFGDLGEISAISIAGAGNTTLTVDAASFAGHSAPKISFDGGTGHNTVIFDNTAHTNWTLTGADQGTAEGGGVALSFSHVANLVGGVGNDALTVGTGGALSGVFDGGGGSNSLSFDNGPHHSAAYSVGPQYNTETLDGQPLNFADVQSIDPASNQVTLGAGLSAEVSQSGSSLAITISGVTTDYQPTANTPFNLILGASDTLKVDSLDFSTIATGMAFDINGNGASIEFAGNLTDTAGLSALVHSSGGQTITDASGAEAITPLNGVDASITVDPGVTITANTIALEAQSTTTASIITDGTSNALTSATITTGTSSDPNSATVTIDGTLDATGGALSALTSLTLNDTVTALDGANLGSVALAAVNNSQVILGAAAVVIGGSVDLGAST